MDLAGVEAGEKMLVLWVGDPLGSPDQSSLPDQNRRSAIRQAQSKLDFILPFKTDLPPFDSDCFSRKGTHCLRP